jgi:Xaa-Pro aminopeptidase
MGRWQGSSSRGDFVIILPHLNARHQVLIDGKTPYAVALMLTSSRFMLAPSWIDQTKAIKNETEIQGFRTAYARDGAAMVYFHSRPSQSDHQIDEIFPFRKVKWLSWLDEQMRAGQTLTEWEAAEELTHYREKGAHYWGLAYENISASGPNAGEWPRLYE